ncbi:copper transporter 2-like [Rosa rugosa]|uniref:copper transporter 2-like n=1 Tax=Rosa rugosa TaxID=74645 RepID=UPI002B400F8D|nr:copper transporter 2-like [Rosa rugosa]
MAASHDSMHAPPTLPFNSTSHRRMMMPITFFWGDNTEVLFSGWPGRDDPVMYVMSLAFVFVLAVLAEWLSHCSFLKSSANNFEGGDVADLFVYWAVWDVVFAFAMEALSVWPTIKPSRSSVVAGLAQAFLYVIRISLGYFVMLAVMSYNIGVFIAAVAGHTVGFFVVKASALSITKPPGPEPSF